MIRDLRLKVRRRVGEIPQSFAKARVRPSMTILNAQ
jgi:hypothetical protein